MIHAHLLFRTFSAKLETATPERWFIISSCRISPQWFVPFAHVHHVHWNCNPCRAVYWSVTQSAVLHKIIYNGDAVTLKGLRNVSVLFILLWIFNEPFSGLRAPAYKVLKAINVSLSSCTFSKPYFILRPWRRGSRRTATVFQNVSLSLCALCL